jgi:hypothetical protein
MILAKLFAKRCVLSSTSTQGIIAPFNMDVSSSLLSSSLLSSSPDVISGDDDDDDIDDIDDIDDYDDDSNDDAEMMMIPCANP